MTSPTRELDDDCPDAAPEHVQSLKHDSSILALTVSDDYIFAGTHKGEIVAWALESFQVARVVQAHKRSVLCLLGSDDDRRLFSSGCEPVVNVWCPRSLTRLVEIYSTYDVGDVFSIAYSAALDTVYIGTQTQYIQWVGLRDAARRGSHDSPHHPDRRHHRFFDSCAVGGTIAPRRVEQRWSLIPRAQTVLEMDPGAVLQFAHYGWVYCMLVARGPTVLVDPGEEVLVSGGGDGTVKLWRLGAAGGVGSAGDVREIMVLGDDDSDSVVSMALDGSFLYSGKLGGTVELWDLDTKQRLRVIRAHHGDVMTLQMRFGQLWSASTSGFASKHGTVPSDGAQGGGQTYRCLSRWKAHDGKVLASAVTTRGRDRLLVTGGNDGDLRVWRVNDGPAAAADATEEPEDVMIETLRRFVAFRTVSSRPACTEDCRRGATFLGSLFKRHGAQVDMLGSGQPHNPVIFARFDGKQAAATRSRILFYGHYDVVAVDGTGGKWHSDPFRLDGRNGFLYGRGVSDNKGPLLAALYAVVDLLQAKALDSDVLFLVEGEEEVGSRGFQDTVRRHKALFGRIDYILLANSYWLDDDVPCLTYGLRGVLHATVCVDSTRPDLHSGVDGSFLVGEPLADLTHLMARLKHPKGRVLLPGFYDGIAAATPQEEARYDDIADILIRRDPARGPADSLKRNLKARWREPNLTVHCYGVSGPDGSLISSHASANLSIRLVPGQDIDDVAASLQLFLDNEFATLQSENRLTVRIDNKAEPWLGLPDSYIFQTLESAVKEAWGLSGDGDDPDQAEDDIIASPEPDGLGSAGARRCNRKLLYIREGGSIPAIRFLEKEFDAPAAHLPCGQASDAAHLDNERLRVLNLQKSRQIFATMFKKL